MYEQPILCKKCHSARAADQKVPCSTCGARATFFGYQSENDFKTFRWATIIILSFVILACLSGVAFLVFQGILLAK